MSKRVVGVGASYGFAGSLFAFAPLAYYTLRHERGL